MFKKAKKKGDLVAHKCLACSFTGKSRFYLRLWESFQMKYPTPPKKANINPTVTTPAITTSSINMAVPLRQFVLDGFKLTAVPGRKIDQDQ